MARRCNRCGNVVTYETVSYGYACACTWCDEDLYLIETYLD